MKVMKVVMKMQNILLTFGTSLQYILRRKNTGCKRGENLKKAKVKKLVIVRIVGTNNEKIFLVYIIHMF
jgi:hypothetical protein